MLPTRGEQLKLDQEKLLLRQARVDDARRQFQQSLEELGEACRQAGLMAEE